MSYTKFVVKKQFDHYFTHQNTGKLKNDVLITSHTTPTTPITNTNVAITTSGAADESV
jgi:hypothetical protein